MKPPVCKGAYYANASVTSFGLHAGHKILIYGASGAIGVAAVQLAKYAGADVTAVTTARHLELAKSFGADRVVDYATSEFRQLGRNFDFVLDAVGKMTVRQWRRLLKKNGRFAVTDLGPWGEGCALPAVVGSHRKPDGDRAASPAWKRSGLRQFSQGPDASGTIPRSCRSKLFSGCDRRRLPLCSYGAKGRHSRDRRLSSLSAWVASGNWRYEAPPAQPCSNGYCVLWVK